MKLILTIIVLLLLAGCTIPKETDLIRRDVEGTGSMRPLLEKLAYPNITTVNKVLGENDSIHLGRIYIYTKDYVNETNTTTKYIVHRLLGIYNISDEIIFIFKGDNNIYLDEIVHREQIIEEVVRINLK